MVRTGRLVEEPGTNRHAFLSKVEAGAGNWEAAPKDWVYSEFEVRTQDIRQGGRAEWRHALFNTKPVMSMKEYMIKRGGSLAPMVRNISPIIKAK